MGAPREIDVLDGGAWGDEGDWGTVHGLLDSFGCQLGMLTQ
jgi:hypothetical protein